MGFLDDVGAALGINDSQAQKDAKRNAGMMEGYAGDLGDFAGDRRAFFEDQIEPRYQELIEYYNSPEALREERGRAGGDYSQSVKMAEDAGRRDYMRRGGNPLDYARTINTGGVMARKASGRVGAMEGAEEGIRRGRMGVLGPGMQYPGMISSGYGNAMSGMGGAANIRLGADRTERLAGTLKTAAKGAAFASTMGASGAAGAGAGIYPGLSMGAYAEGGPLELGRKDAWEPRRRKYAEGGEIQGPGTGTSDSIPATIEGQEPIQVSDGEFLVPADVTKYLGHKFFYEQIMKAREEMKMGGPQPKRQGPAGGQQGQQSTSAAA